MTKDDQKMIEHNRALVKQWLLEQRYSIEKEPKEVAQEWAIYAVEFGGNFKFAASQPAGNAEVIAVAVTFDFRNFRPELERMDADEREDFILELWFKLLSLELEFRPLGDPLLYGVLLSCHIYVDEMKRSVFWRNVHVLRRAFWFCQWTFQRKFSKVSLPQVVSSDSIN